MSESPDRRDIDDLEERLACALAQLGWCLPVESSREDPSSDTLPAHLANPAEVFVWENGVPRCYTTEHRMFERLTDLGAVLPLTQRDPSSRRKFGRWMVAAAVMLIAIAGIAVGREYVARKPLLVATSGSRGARVAEFSLRSGLDFQGAGVPPEAEILDWVNFVVENAGMGIVVAVRNPGAAGLDLCAFGPHGEPLWAARRDWDDWGATLGKEGVGLRSLRCLVVRSSSKGMEEGLCLVLQRSFVCCVLVVDPIRGAVRGKCFYPGVLGRGDNEVIATMPDSTDGPRRLLLAGHHGHGDRAQASVLVLELDGRVVQHLVFPNIELRDPLEMRVSGLRTDWSPDRPEVTIDTSESVHFSFLVRDRQLDTRQIVSMLTDSVGPAYDRRHGSGGFERLLERAGGELAWLQALSQRVRETGDAEFPRGWRGE